MVLGMIKRILLGLTGGPINRAMNELTVGLAKANGASVTGLAIEDADQLNQMDNASIGFYSHQVKDMERRQLKAEERAQDRLSELEQACSEAGVNCKGLFETGELLSLGVKAWRFHDLLLMSANPWLLGADHPESVTLILKLVAAGIRPVITVPLGAPVKIKRVIVALSSSLESAKAMKHLVQMELFPGAELHLVTVGAPKSGEGADELLANAKAYCEAHGYKVTTAELYGPGSAAILEETERAKADLIVMGSSFKRFLFAEKFGSHAISILEKSHVPVFLSH